MSFLRKGKAVHEEVEREEAFKASLYGPRRFWVNRGEEARITFLDGHLEDGLVQAVSYHEHMLKRPGTNKYIQYPCTQEIEPCPICEDGDVPSLVAVFTILDHREWKDKNNKIHKWEKKLFVCKRDTFKRLQAKAAKQGGLFGVTFDVTRIGEKAPAVGTDFDVVEKTTLEKLSQMSGIPVSDLAPFEYSTAIKYFSAAELRKMGFGKPTLGSSDTTALKNDGSIADIADEL
jgi:hypothetical protein